MDDFQLVQLRYPEPDPEIEPSPEMLVALRDARILLEQYQMAVVGKDFHNMLNMLCRGRKRGKERGRWCRRIGLNPLRWERRRERHHQEQDHRLEERLGRSCHLSNYFLCIVIRFAHNSFVSGQIKTLAALLGFLRLLVSLGLERAISFICWEDGQSKSLKKRMRTTQELWV